MRRLGFFACIAVLLLCFFVTAAWSVSAQSTQGTYDYFYDKGFAVFTETESALGVIREAQARQTSDSRTPAILGWIDEHINQIGQTKQAYITSFNASKTASKAPVDTQIEAIRAGRTKYTDVWNTMSVQAKGEPRAQAVQRIFINKFDGTSSILTEALKIKGGELEAGSEEATTYGESAPLTVAGSEVAKAVTNAAKCKITDFSLVDCVDVMVAWLIKNTLLQIAAALTWLSANILNHAVYYGILEFKQWAPDTLYPIWVIIRQIVSLAVVFAGLFLGFMYIIGRETTFGRYVGWLIIFALFVNFSYPVTRAITDVSNIISLNIYTAAVGAETLTSVNTESGSNNSAGRIIMNRLGLDGLIVSITKTQDSKNSALSDINSTPNALVALVFVFYAAYIFFAAAILIITRTAVLVFLTVASPLLLIDSVVPKMGEVAAKMRKLFFEQLVVAPVFMIMLALTLKFMEVFKTSGALTSSVAGAATVTGAATVSTFFNLIMMLVMLHITIKVTKSISGSAGEFATKWAGKIGGFGLGVASGGTGMLARASIGAAAARARDSGWMDKAQGSRTGRGLYMLTNSLAQSTFDTRNSGLLNKGMGAAGFTNLQAGLGQGSKRTYESNVETKRKNVTSTYERIQDPEARQKYYDQVKHSPFSTQYTSDKIARDLDVKEMELKKKEEAQMKAFASGNDDTRKEMILRAHADPKQRTLAEKMVQAQKYFDEKGLKIDENNPVAVEVKNLEVEENALREDLERSEADYKNNKSKVFEGRRIFANEESIEIGKLEKELSAMPQITTEQKRLHDEKAAILEEKKKEHELDVRLLDEEEKAVKDELARKRSGYEAKEKLLAERRQEHVEDVADKKSDVLLTLDSKTATDIIENDAFEENQKQNLKEIKKMEEDLALMGTGTPEEKRLRSEKMKQIEKRKADNREMVQNLRKEIRTAYMNKYYKQSGPRPLDIELGEEEPTVQPADRNPHPGGSDTSAYEDGMYDLPPNMRASAGNEHPGGSDVEGNYDLPPAMRGGVTRQEAFGNLTRQSVPNVFDDQSASRATNNANPSAGRAPNAPTRSAPTPTSPLPAATGGQTANFAIRQNRGGVPTGGTTNFAVDPNAAKPNYTMYAPVTRQQDTTATGVRDFSQNGQAFDMGSKTLADVVRQRRANNQPSNQTTPQTEPPLEESQAALQRQSLNEMTAAAADVQNASRNNGGGVGTPPSTGIPTITPQNYFEVRKAQKQKREEEEAKGNKERIDLYYARRKKEDEEDLKLLPEVYRNAVKNNDEYTQLQLKYLASGYSKTDEDLKAIYAAIDREMGSSTK